MPLSASVDAAQVSTGGDAVGVVPFRADGTVGVVLSYVTLTDELEGPALPAPSTARTV